MAKRLMDGHCGTLSRFGIPEFLKRLNQLDTLVVMLLEGKLDNFLDEPEENVHDGMHDQPTVHYFNGRKTGRPTKTKKTTGSTYKYSNAPRPGAPQITSRDKATASTQLNADMAQLNDEVYLNDEPLSIKAEARKTTYNRIWEFSIRALSSRYRSSLAFNNANFKRVQQDGTELLPYDAVSFMIAKTSERGYGESKAPKIDKIALQLPRAMVVIHERRYRLKGFKWRNNSCAGDSLNFFFKGDSL